MNHKLCSIANAFCLSLLVGGAKKERKIIDSVFKEIDKQKKHLPEEFQKKLSLFTDEIKRCLSHIEKENKLPEDQKIDLLFEPLSAGLGNSLIFPVIFVIKMIIDLPEAMKTWEDNPIHEPYDQKHPDNPINEILRLLEGIELYARQTTPQNIQDDVEAFFETGKACLATAKTEPAMDFEQTKTLRDQGIKILKDLGVESPCFQMLLAS